MKHKKTKHLVIMSFVILVTAAFFFSGVFKKAEIKNVLIISIDTCRADYLSCYGFSKQITPNIDKIAKVGVLFENAYTTVPLTLPAHTSMLSGKIPPYHGVHTNGDHLNDEPTQMLAEVFKKNGFTTAGFISAFVLDSKFGIAQGFDHYDDDIEVDMESPLVDERRGEQVNERVFDWLETNSNNKFFMFVHYYDPHFRYDPPEPFKSEYKTDPYAGEIAYVDHCVGELIKKLKQLDLYDSTLIVLTADHGEMRGEHRELTHGYFIYQGVIKVPLIFKVPGGKKGIRIKENAGLIDIAPTLCALTGNALSGDVQGRDISKYFLQKKVSLDDRQYYCETMRAIEYDCNPLLGVVSGDYKYIQTTRPELYNLKDDPAEVENLVQAQPKRSRIMKDMVIQVIEADYTITDTKTDLDPETKARLESLGYVSAGDYEASFEFDDTKPDPKDLIEFHELNTSLSVALLDEQYLDLEFMCNKMIRINPDFAAPYRCLGDMAYRKQSYEKAIEYFMKYLDLEPDRTDVLGNVALAYGHMEQSQKALKWFNIVIEKRPNDMRAYYNRGMQYYKMGMLEKALKDIKKAQELMPDNKDIQNTVRVFEEELEKG